MGFFYFIVHAKLYIFCTTTEKKKKEKKVQTVTKSDINGANIMEFVKRTKLEL